MIQRERESERPTIGERERETPTIGLVYFACGCLVDSRVDPALVPVLASPFINSTWPGMEGG